MVINIFYAFDIYHSILLKMKDVNILRTWRVNLAHSANKFRSQQVGAVLYF